jgi:transposase
MQDTELYRQVLGLEEPWSVDRVEVDTDGGRVDIWVAHAHGERWACPQCESELPCHDHVQERVWRHLDTCQLKTFLHARIPRVNCPDHKVVQVKVPWAEARSRFTLLMERWIIDMLQQCATVQGVCRLLDLSWDQVWGVAQRAVKRGQRRKEARVIPTIGVDEKAFRKGHKYMTVVCDLAEGTVEHVAEERTTASLESYYEGLSTEQLAGIEAVAMDMWQPYVKATRAWVPGADQKIVFDRFHVMGHLGKAVDTVRKREHRALLAQGDKTLKGTKYLWLFSDENLPDSRRPTLEALQAMNLKVGKARAVTETFRELWKYRTVGWGRRFFKKWFYWATHCRVDEIREVAHRIRSHLEYILTYCRHRVTNAVAVGLNSKIMAIKRRAGGYRNKEHFKIAIYFYCGGLDLYPH